MFMILVLLCKYNLPIFNFFEKKLMLLDLEQRVYELPQVLRAPSSIKSADDILFVMRYILTKNKEDEGEPRFMFKTKHLTVYKK